MTHTLNYIPVRKKQNRSQLLIGTGCAALAMAMLVSAERAEAQAINATETFVQGAGNREAVTLGSEVIQIDTPTAVIDWVPIEDGAGNALDFLPTGNDVTFENTIQGTDFAVLNRILPATNNNVVVIDGTVVSQLQDGLGGTTPGGTVAFYSPTGLFIGDNAVFDVGNLILTTLDIDIGSFDAFTQGGGSLSLSVDPILGPQAITINPGASITASAENSYFVVTAAEIQMFGTSDVNGSQAFVAGDEVLLTLDNGLFDIQVLVGTSAANPIVFDGDVGGPSSTGIGDNHLIYAVAAAQNDPISLLFSGNLGFQPAASAGIVNGEIIISANYDVTGRAVSGGTVDGGIFQDFIDNTPQNPTQADVFLTDFTSTSTVLAAATNEVQVSAQNESSFIDGDLIMVGRGFSELTSSNGQTFDITGSVLVSANDFGEVSADVFDPSVIDGIGGVAFIDAFGGGTLNITGDARVTARGGGGYDLLSNEGGLGQGGSAQLGSTGGFLNVGGDAIVTALGDGFALDAELNSSRDSIGGTAAIFARDAGVVMIGGIGDVAAEAGGRNATLAGTVGGDAIGGNALFESTNGGIVEIAAEAFLNANAFGGSSNSNSAASLADAGDARVIINGTGSVQVNGQLFATADGFGGQNTGGAGGDAIGGSVGISVLSGGSFTGLDSVQSSASARGGEGLTTGGNGIGGIADIVANGGSTIDLAGETQLSADGTGGEGETGGDGFGGVTAIVSNVGGISIGGNAILSSIGNGGNASVPTFGGSGGIGTGGRSQIAAEGTLTEIGEITINGTAFLSANGLGGEGGVGDGSAIAAGAGGDGIGGSNSTVVEVDPTQTGGAFLTAGVDNGRLTIFGNSNVEAFGTGGTGGGGGTGQDGGAGGNGVGGFSQAGLVLHGGGDGSVNLGFANIAGLIQRGDAFGGSGGLTGAGGAQRGDGGDGTGGIAQLVTNGGILTAGAVSQFADGNGQFGGNGGDGFGGVASVFTNDGSDVTIDSIFARAGAFGGLGENGVGGNAIAGLAEWRIGDATASSNGVVDLSAPGVGGQGGAGVGGNATGGTTELDTNSPNSSFQATDIVLLNANANAGQGVSTGAGASATAGTVNIFADSGGSVSAFSIFANANATGGSNLGTGAGGDATGGTVLALTSDNGSITTSDGDLSLAATANGGTATGGGAGGNATGGESNVLVGQFNGSVGSVFSQVNVSANSDAFGGSGIGGGDATAGAAIVQVQSGTLDALGGLIANANATGGSSTAPVGFGGDGGVGTGGFAIVGAFGADGRTASVSADTVSVSASAIGGNGGQGDGSTINAGNGGDGFGGSSRMLNISFPTQTNGAFIFVSDVNSNLDVTGFSSATALGTGGTGGNGGLDQAGGDGGNGFGGLASFGNSSVDIDAADDLNDGTSVATITDLVLENSGLGGDGGFGGSTFDPMGNGGDGSAGVTEFDVSLDQASVTAAGVTLTIGNLDALSNGFGGAGDIAGNGFGGVASVSAVSNGELTIAFINAEAIGNGGSGRIGGDGLGGGAADPGVVNGGTGIGFRNGSVIITGDAGFSANGFGGSSTGGDGGTGIGGFATFQNTGFGADPALQGELTIGGFGSLLAEGIGGDGGGGFTGGDGTGGLARINVAVGGTLLLDSAQIAAGGVGGTGIAAAGGTGIGGTALIASRDAGSDVTITNGLDFINNIGQSAQGGLLSANGLGGTATGGTGIGGDGIGGTVSVIATDQGSITLPLDPSSGSNRILGRGAGGQSSVDGGSGGFASAGTGLFEADTGGEITTGPTLFSVFAFGGFSSQAFDDNATINVDGGDAEGGERSIIVRNGAVLTGEFFGGTAGGSGGNASGTGIGGSGTGGRGIYIFEDATFNAVGRNILGGGGGSGGEGEIGGNGSGGDNSVTISNSTINLISNGNSSNPAGLPDTPSLVIFNQNLAGGGVSQGGNATGGTIDVLISNSTITGGTFTISNLAQGGAADLATGTGGTANSGAINLNVLNSVLEVQNGEDTQGFMFDPNTGMNLPGEIFPGDASQIISVAQGGAGLNAGDANSGRVDATFFGGSVAINQSSTADGLFEFVSTATAGDGTDQLGIATSGTVDAFFTGTDIFGDILSVRSDAASAAIQPDAVLGVAIAGSAGLALFGDATVTLSELNVSATGTTSLTGQAEGGFADLLVSGLSGQPGPQVDVDTLRLAADGIGGTPNGSNNRHGAFTLDVIDSQLTTRVIDASAAGDTLAGGETGPSVVNANGGTIEVVDQLTVDAFADVIVRTFDGGTIGDADPGAPSALIDITTQNTLQFNGNDDLSISFRGAALNLSSNDIIINDGARIGAPEIILNSLNLEDPAVLGGGGTPGGFVDGEGYTLISEELERIEVGLFTFNQEALPIDPINNAPNPGFQAGQAIGPNDPSLIIRDYVASGSAGDGTSNISLNVNGAGGVLRIEGVTGLEDATAADSIFLTAAERIEIVTPGGVGIVDVDGNPIGALLLESANIWAADAETITQLQNDPNFAGRNDLLASPATGSDDPLGYIRGGEVSIIFSESLLVRNTGTNEEQGGILVGDGGLFISNELGADSDVFAYGARFDSATGDLITGEEFFNEVEFFSGSTGSSSFNDEASFNDCLINTGECIVRASEPEPEGPTEEEEIVEQEAAQAINATSVEAAVQAAIEVVASEEESNEDFGMDFPSFVEAEDVEDEGDVDDPVASGGDASLYGQNISGNVELGGSIDE
ncbi:hypothetical protein [uncultured Erythrobacter sp.]|uniref:hypothetical protein n=1 Tax=uncultured Erythrobacter sp. TaxID=263913 RepID=UPI002635CDD9|nr:hypothetical protein [uncultured Erythrobacter sp.]